VHGTWGRGFFPSLHWSRTSRWFESGGSFYERFSKELTNRSILATFATHDWSGANSIFARDKAAADLARKLEEHDLVSPGCTQLIIGHSHGGNVVGRALARLSTTKPNPLICTLAKPFVEVHPTDLGPRYRLMTAFVLALAVAFITILTNRLGLYLASIDVISVSVENFLALGSFVAQFVIAYALVTRYRRRRGPSSRVSALAEATSLKSTFSRANPMLIIRAIDDEASLTLALGAIINRVTKVLLRIVVILLLVGLILGTALAVAGIQLYSPAFHPTPLYWVSSAVEMSVPIALALFGLVLLSRGVYGRELALAPLSCQINSQSTPDAENAGKIITLVNFGTTPGAMRHMIYEHEDCASVLADWLRAHLVQSVAKSDSAADRRNN
jgi:hypothetical protein